LIQAARQTGLRCRVTVLYWELLVVPTRLAGG